MAVEITDVALRLVAFDPSVGPIVWLDRRRSTEITPGYRFSIGFPLVFRDGG